MRLQDRVAVVTGGANGIGRATCRLFAREGAAVVVADRDAEAGAATVAEIEAAGGHAAFASLDVSVDADVEALPGLAAAAFGPCTVLANCAGVDISGTVVDTEPERWQRVLDVNLGGIYRTCRALIPGMVDAGGGAIVNVSSIQGMYGWRRYAGYAAAKAGIFGLTRQIAVDYADDDVRANCVSPGAITTELGANSARLEPDFRHRHAPPPPDPQAPAPTPAPGPRLRRAGTSEDVAFAVLFLASDEAGHISGQNLVVDGITTSRVS